MLRERPHPAERVPVFGADDVVGALLVSVGVGGDCLVDLALARRLAGLIEQVSNVGWVWRQIRTCSLIWRGRSEVFGPLVPGEVAAGAATGRSEEHTSELQS